MNFSFENQGTMTYLVYAISDGDTIDSMSLGMLTNNKIQGLAPAIFTQMDATKYIKYNVSSKISVKQFFEGAVNKKRLLGVFNGIVDAMLSAEDYMIDTNSILLDLNYIFADVSTCETVLVCLPVVGQGNGPDMATFFKTIMFSTQFDQTENCDHVARIINYLNSSPVFSLVDFKEVLNSLNGDATPTTVQPVVQSKVEQPVQPKTVQQPIQPSVQPLSQTSAPQTIHNVQPAVQKTTPPIQQPQSANFSVPPAQAPASGQQIGKPEKQISMFGLLMHYSKENKALYDAQKAAKKASKGQVPPSPAPQQPTKQPQNAGFAVPGVQSNAGFAIPGQPVPAVNTQQQKPPQVQPSEQNQPQQKVLQPLQPSYSPPAQPVSQPIGRSASFGETTVLGGSGKIGETTVLGTNSSEVQMQPHLIRIKNNERINLDKPVFRIGKEKSYVDYFVSDNTAVSRSHANIITRGDQYFIVDTNSTNHTYINGGMIQSNVETLLSHGTKIRLANEEFEFRLY